MAQDCYKVTVNILRPHGLEGSKESFLRRKFQQRRFGKSLPRRLFLAKLLNLLFFIIIMSGRFIERNRLLGIARSEFEKEPVLFVRGLEYVINGILNTREIDVIIFDMKTRHLAANLLIKKKTPEQAIIYTRRIIAAFAFNGILPEERANKINAGFAYDKTGRSAHFAAVHSDEIEKLPWYLRSLISRGRSSELYASLNRFYDAHVACVYGLADAIESRRLMELNPEGYPKKWDRNRLEEEIKEISKRAGDMIPRCKAISEEIRQLYENSISQIIL